MLAELRSVFRIASSAVVDAPAVIAGPTIRTFASGARFFAAATASVAAFATESGETFRDVPKGSYYEDAVTWAAANGITTGIGGGLFGPNQSCTRAQIVTFLYRAYQGR